MKDEGREGLKYLHLRPLATAVSFVKRLPPAIKPNLGTDFPSLPYRHHHLEDLDNLSIRDGRLARTEPKAQPILNSRTGYSCQNEERLLWTIGDR